MQSHIETTEHIASVHNERVGADWPGAFKAALEGQRQDKVGRQMQRFLICYAHLGYIANHTAQARRTIDEPPRNRTS